VAESETDPKLVGRFQQARGQGREGLAEAFPDGFTLTDVQHRGRERPLAAPLHDLVRVVAPDGHPDSPLAEIGTDMSVFPSAEHLRSWALVRRLNALGFDVEVRPAAA